MDTVKNESDLLKIIKDNIISAERQSVKIFAGHMPLLYNQDRTVELGVERWGEFSMHTFELGCRVYNFARENGKRAIFFLVIDDSIELTDQLSEKRKNFDWSKRPRQRLYNKNKIPEQYNAILTSYNIPENSFMTQIRNIKSKKNNYIGKMKTRLISENHLKSNATRLGIAAPNECSLAYKAILSDANYFNTSEDYLIGFIPGQCKGNLCDGVLKLRNDLYGMHVFFPHIDLMSGLMPNSGIRVESPLSIREMYEESWISYTINKPMI